MYIITDETFTHWIPLRISRSFEKYPTPTSKDRKKIVRKNKFLRERERERQKGVDKGREGQKERD